MKVELEVEVEVGGGRWRWRCDRLEPHVSLESGEGPVSVVTRGPAVVILVLTKYQPSDWLFHIMSLFMSRAGGSKKEEAKYRREVSQILIQIIVILTSN